MDSSSSRLIFSENGPPCRCTGFDPVIGPGYILFLKWGGIFLEHLLQKKEQGFFFFKPCGPPQYGRYRADTDWVMSLRYTTFRVKRGVNSPACDFPYRLLHDRGSMLTAR